MPPTHAIHATQENSHNTFETIDTTDFHDEPDATIYLYYVSVLTPRSQMLWDLQTLQICFPVCLQKQ